MDIKAKLLIIANMIEALMGTDAAQAFLKLFGKDQGLTEAEVANLEANHADYLKMIDTLRGPVTAEAQKPAHNVPPGHPSQK